MSRLIDADLLKKNIAKWLQGSDPQETRMVQVEDIAVSVCMEIEEQPTAFDTEKVVEQLEEKTDFLKDCTKYGNNDAEQQEKSYSTVMMYEVADLVEDLIDIVKKGGVE